MASKKNLAREKLFYKIGEVCELTDTQPYVLRFWESEFPQLSPKKNRSGQRTYRKLDIDLVTRIKHLLHDEGYTIAGARKRLDDDEEAPPLESARQSAPGKSRPRVGEEQVRKAVTGLREILDTMRRVDDKLDRLS